MSEKKAHTTPLQKKLASQIVNWLTSEQVSAGFRLKEAELAERFGVSRTPVRAALNYLQERGIVLSLPYKGFELQQDAASIRVPDQSAVPTAAEEQVYMEILLDLFFKQPGSSFSEQDLMQSYQISRPVSQVLLRQLERDHLISKGPGYKWQVNQGLNNLQHHYESYRCRLIIEPAALLEPRWQLDRERLEAIRHRHLAAIRQPDRVSARELFQLSGDFHEGLMICSDNRFLLGMMQQQNRLRKATDLISMHLKSSVVKACQRRLDILDAVLAGDNTDAAVQLKALLENDIRVMESSYQQLSGCSVQQLKQWLQDSFKPGRRSL